MFLDSFRLAAIVFLGIFLGVALQGCSRGRKKSASDRQTSRSPRQPLSEIRLKAVEDFLKSGGALRKCDVKTVDAKDLSWDSFSKNYRGKPALLTGFENLGYDWTKDRLLRTYGMVQVKANNGRFDNFRTREVTTIDEYLQSNDSDSNIFSVEHDAKSRMPHVYSAGQLPLFSGFNYRPILSLGLAASPTYAHRHQETWLHLLAGRKAWWLGRDTGSKARLPVKGDPCASLPADALGATYEDFHLCIQEPGEVMYFGNLSSHATCNLDLFVLAVGAQGHTEGLPRFQQAVRRNDEVEIKHLASKAEDVDEKDYLNRTALQHAAMIGHSTVVAALLEARAALNPGEPQPLHSAAEFGNLDIISQLLKAGASLHAIDSQGGQAIHYAAKGGHLSALEALLAHGSDVRNGANTGAEPLHWAAMEANAATIRYLLENRGDVNAAEKGSKYTALHYAAEHGHVKNIKALLTSGADLNVKDRLGLTPLQKASVMGREKAKDVLTRWKSSEAVPENLGEF